MTKLDQGRVKTSSKRHRSHTGTPSNSDEDFGDLRGMLEERHYQRNKTLEESQRVVKVVHDNRSKPYDAPSRQYGHNTDHKGSSVKSDRERSGLPDDDRRSQWDATLDYENRGNTGPHRRSRSRNRHKSSESDGRSSQSRRSKETRKRYEHNNPTQTRRGGGGDMNRRRRLLLEIRERVANIPMQETTEYDYRFKNMSHATLPVRSLKENCTHVNQYRRYIDDNPPRESEVADNMLAWVLHFEALRDVPQFTINFRAETLEAAYWWRHFYIEIGILDEEDHVFQEQTHSAPTKTRKAEGDGTQ